MNKTKLRRGIGYMGRVFQYGTACGSDGASLRSKGPRGDVTTLNKFPEFKCAAKKRQRLDDARIHGE